MIRTFSVALAIGIALAAGGCSTKPRQFSASVRPLAETPQVSADQGAHAAFAHCDQMVRKGHKRGFVSAAASGGAGIAAAAATTGTVVLNGATSATMFGFGSTAVAAVPVVGVLAAFGMNRMIRGGRERGYRKHMGTCFTELGYQVVDWSRAPKKQRATAMLAPPAPATTAEAPGEITTEATAASAPTAG